MQRSTVPPHVMLVRSVAQWEYRRNGPGTGASHAPAFLRTATITGDPRRFRTYDAAMLRSTLPLAAALAGCGSHAEATGPDALIVAPASVALTVGRTVEVAARFQRNGADVAGDAVTWSSSDPGRAVVEGRDTSATITAVAAGNATITASGGGLSATVEVAISLATLTGIAIAPDAPAVAAGTTRPVSVLATYSDQTTADVATQVVWSSAQPSIASASGAVLTGFVKGETTIAAMYMGLVANTRVRVTDPLLRLVDVMPTMPHVVVGLTQQFTATGSFSDGSSSDLTASVTWASSAGAVATVSNAAGSEGLATTLTVGETMISATSGRVTGMAKLTVDPIR